MQLAGDRFLLELDTKTKHHLRHKQVLHLLCLTCNVTNWSFLLLRYLFACEVTIDVFIVIIEVFNCYFYFSFDCFLAGMMKQLSKNDSVNVKNRFKDEYSRLVVIS